MDTSVGKMQELNSNGFTVIENLFDEGEVNNLIAAIDAVEANEPTFRKSADLFAIRQFLKEVPEVFPYFFNDRLRHAITAIFGRDYFMVKSIYFDKPPLSNWFVAYHQDITISVAEKFPFEGYVNWTVKQGYIAVQPPAEILGDNFTVRLHLDDTDENNGALKVIAGSHNNGILQNPAGLPGDKGTVCPVKKGGVMIMRPLLRHASGRTLNGKRRRVIHIEFSKAVLPEPLQWAEKQLVEWL
jgi:ectoine hydroxylase-related dioxygenase (phytanoyl-CoA dioxygenase family)